MKIERTRLLEIIKEEIDSAKTRIPRQSQERVPEALERGQGSMTLVAQYQNVAKGAAMEILDAAEQMEQAPSHEPASSFAPEVAKQANIVVDQLVEIEKLVLPEKQLQEQDPWSKLAKGLQESGDPWQKLAGTLQEEEGGVSQKVNSMLKSILQKVRGADYSETLIEVEEDLTRVIRLISKSGGALQEAAPPQIDPETGKYPPPPEIPDVPSIPENLQLNVIDFLETIAGLKFKGSDIISREASKLLARIEGEA